MAGKKDPSWAQHPEKGLPRPMPQLQTKCYQTSDEERILKLEQALFSLHVNS